MTKRKTLVSGLIILLVACWIYAAPYLAVRSMRKAVENRDAVALADYVNFPALKESLKASFTAHMAKVMAEKKDNNAFAALGVAMANALINPMIDSLVSPEGLSAMMNGQNPSLAKQKEEQTLEARSGSSDDEPITKMRYENFNRFTVSTSDKRNQGREVTMVFLRDGLSWKLSAIRLPADDALVAVSTTPNQPEISTTSDQQPQGEVQQLMAKEEVLNDKCRGGSGDSPDTMTACDQRNNVLKEIENLGWCWGHKDDIGANRTWVACIPTDAQPSENRGGVPSTDYKATLPIANNPSQQPPTSVQTADKAPPQNPAPLTETSEQANTGPSFNCSKASTQVEIMVCGNTELSALDRKMVTAYKDVLASASPDNIIRIKSEGTRWRTSIRDKCGAVECVRNAYLTRIGELSR
jgi:hypothetical protein